MRYRDRPDAGRVLATHLSAFANRSDVVVLGLPRGGVPVAAEVARALAVPLDIFLVRKLGAPGQPEFAMGAVAEGGIEVIDTPTVEQLNIPTAAVRQAAAQQRLQLERQDHNFRAGRPAPDVRNRIVILVDDGLATGATMKAAIVALRQGKPAQIIAAAPVGARDTCQRLRAVADEVVCPYTPEQFNAVGQWYDRFDQTNDDEVRAALSDGWIKTAAGPL